MTYADLDALLNSFQHPADVHMALAEHDPARHCFREDSPGDSCRSCGFPAGRHSGCDCYPDQPDPAQVCHGTYRYVVGISLGSTICDRCGDVSNSDPDLPCGRRLDLEEEE